MCRSDAALLVALLAAGAACACGSSDGDSALFHADAAVTVQEAAVKDAGSVPLPPSGGDASVLPGSGTCVPPLARCDAPGAACCSGAVCVESGDTKRCVQTCTTRFDCGSLCCMPDEAGRNLCVDSARCPPIPCSDVGGACEGPGRSCCAGLACVSSSSPDYGGCRKPCKDAKECDSGCCVPYADGTLGFCAAAAACACAGAGETCGGTKHCCSGLACGSGSTADTFDCKPVCTKNTDCASGCCVAIPGTPDSACYPAEFCPKQ